MEKKILWNDHAIDMSLFRIGQSYSRNEIRDIGSLPNHLARENWTGIVSLQNAVLIFVTLDKANADKNHLYKDYFEGSDFFWESQNRNTINTSPLNRIISDDTNYLFIRVVEKIKSYCQASLAGFGLFPVHATNVANRLWMLPSKRLLRRHLLHQRGRNHGCEFIGQRNGLPSR